MNLQMQKILISIMTTSSLFVAGCSSNSVNLPDIPDFPVPSLVHKVNVQQGNIVDQAQVNKLRPGMDKNQVNFIMGTPSIVDTFHNDRWEYIYTMYEGNKDKFKQKRISLFFEDQKLARIQGDVIPQPVNQEAELAKQNVEVEVPPQKEELDIVKRVIEVFSFSNKRNTDR